MIYSFVMFKIVKNKKILISLPGIVLSKMNATEPPTNMAVVRRTFKTWSISTIPVKYNKTWTLLFKTTEEQNIIALPKIAEIKITLRKENSVYRCILRSSTFVSEECAYSSFVGGSVHSTHQWLVGSVWGSLAELNRRRWRIREQRGFGRSWGPQTAGWTVRQLWSCQKGYRTKLPRRDQGEMQTGHWICPRAPETASWQLHTESHVCFPPGKQ